MNEAVDLSLEEIFNLALTEHGAGRLGRAEELYRRALERDPDQPDAHHNLGLILGGRGAAEARLHLAIAVQNRPAEGQFWIDYIEQLRLDGLAEAGWRALLQAKALGLRGQAVEALERALGEQRPDGALRDLESLFSEGRFAEVEAIARVMLLQQAGNGSLHGVLAAAVYQQGRRREALPIMQRSVELEPRNSQLLYNLAVAQCDLRLFEEAEATLRQGLAGEPNDRTLLSKLGAVLNDLGRAGEAVPLFERAMALGPADAVLLNNAGNAHLLLGRLGEAESFYRQAVALDQEDAQAHNNIGNLELARQNPAEAEKHYRRAVELNRQLAEAHANWAEALRMQGRLVEAYEKCALAIELEPTFPTAHQLKGVLSSYMCDHGEVVTASDKAFEYGAPARAAWETRLYTFSYHPDLPAEAIFEEFVRWGDRFPDPVVDFSGHDRTPGRRLRIGYVSPDFRKHTSRFYFMPLMANHDHAAFETFAYSNVLNPDEVTEDFRGVFDHWRDIRSLSAEEAARLVREDRIDILVDCCNHMLDDRLDVFALKPAPIQATWLGAAWTTGLKTVDYVLFDPHLAPEGTLAREEIVRLPASFLCYRPDGRKAEVAPLPALGSGHVAFGYTGRTERLNHKTFRVWGEILRRVPGSRLILDYLPFADPRTQDHYRRLMAEQGLDPERVEMRRSADIFQSLGEIDILLDSFPHSGGTMLFDALWAGVPALTLKSRPPLGRIGVSLMMALGMPEWVAETEEDYVAKAVAFAADLPALAALRAGLRERMKASPLMDEPAFAKGFEDAYLAMWARYTGPVDADAG